MYFDGSLVVARWSNTGAVKENWGDKLNPELIRLLSGKPVVHVDDVQGWGDRPVHNAIGSHIVKATGSDVIWGTGLLAADQVVTPPLHVAAVRGPLTRERLLAQGISCPDIYGDPALLYPLFYSPPRQPSVDIGFIQHYREHGKLPLPRFDQGLSVEAIDIRAGLRAFVDHLVRCSLIVSSSLHGLIAAHAYGIPAVWLKASDLPLGDDIKFRDYWASIGHDAVEPARIDADGRFVQGSCPTGPAEIRVDADALLTACPFMDLERKRSFRKRRRMLAQGGREGLIFRQP